MICRKSTFAIALIVLMGLIPYSTQAAPLRIPADVYPAGAHIGYRPVLTNTDVDCMWGFICEGGSLPNFHFSTQNELHRMGGWGQFAGIQERGRTTMAFELFINRYDPVPDETGTAWSQRALLDLRAALQMQGYRQVSRTGDVFPVEGDGAALVEIQNLGKQDLVVMATWTGTLEIEGIALYDHRSTAARQTAWHSLVRQLHRALQFDQ